MAEIVPLKEAALRLARKATATAPRPAGPAQILFFTGVRYERRDGETLPERPRKRRKAAKPQSDAALLS